MQDAVKRKSNLYIMVMVDRGNPNELEVCPKRSKCGIKTFFFPPHTKESLIIGAICADWLTGSGIYIDSTL